MRHWTICAVLALLPYAAVAGDARLEPLETSEAGRGWNGVGRLNLNGRGFCTGALIAPDLVLTAAHCLFDKASKARIDQDGIEFLAGWRNGRAAAYRQVRRAVVHPAYVYDGEASAGRVRNDLALLELSQPIRNTAVAPFGTGAQPRRGELVGVVSYAHDRAEAPSLQETCGVMARQEGVLILSCNVDFGASGAPVFSFAGREPRIVSVVSAKAEVEGQSVALGTPLDGPLELLRAELEAGRGFDLAPAPEVNRMAAGARRETGAKFVRP